MKKKDFKPHMMYDPKTGKGVKADTYEKHLALKKKGYGHSKPKKKRKLTVPAPADLKLGAFFIRCHRKVARFPGTETLWRLLPILNRHERYRTVF